MCFYTFKEEKLHNGYRKLDLNDNNIRDCIQIIDRENGWAVANVRKLKNFGKLIPTGGITKEYFECLRLNNKLNEQKIIWLTKELLQMKRR